MALLFQIEDVGSWLKNLRLHKYGSLFSQLSYEEMLGLNEEYLESKVGRQLVMAVHPSYIYSLPHFLLVLLIIDRYLIWPKIHEVHTCFQ